MYFRKNKIWNLKESSITSEKIFKARRESLKKIAIGSLIVPSTLLSSFPAFSSLYPPISNNSYKIDRDLTKENLATTYTNFYEFGSSKNIWRRAAQLTTNPWLLTIDGLVNKPLTIDVHDLLKKIGGIEEKVYMKVSGDKIKAVTEVDVDRTSEEGKASSVQFIHFKLTDAQISKFKDFSEVEIGIDHKDYSHTTKLNENTIKALLSDFN